MDLFRGRYDEIYTAVMLSVGAEKHTLKRSVPTVIDSLTEIGGLYYSVLFIAIGISIVFFKPIDDLNLLAAW